MRKMMFAAALTLAPMVVLALPALAQAPSAPPPPAMPDFTNVQETVTELGHNMYALTGAGGNVTIAVGKDAIIMVDAQYAPLHDRLKAKIASISPLPIKYLINTHYHIDHTSGDALFAQEGAVLVSTAALAAAVANPPNGQAPAPAGGVPTKTYAGKEMTLKVPGVTAHLVHPASAHTGTDTIVLWPDANVISTGDIVGSATYPNIDVKGGGSIGGIIEATDFILAHCNDGTKVVVGHGAVTDKAGVTAWRAMLVTARDRIAKAKASGMTEDQVADANLLSDLDPKWKAAAGSPAARFPRLVYETLK